MYFISMHSIFSLNVPIIFPKVYNVNFSALFRLTFLFSSAILHHVPAMETPMRSFMYLPILRNARMIFITMYKYNNSTAIITETMEKKKWTQKQKANFQPTQLS